MPILERQIYSIYSFSEIFYGISHDILSRSHSVLAFSMVTIRTSFTFYLGEFPLLSDYSITDQLHSLSFSWPKWIQSPTKSSWTDGNHSHKRPIHIYDVDGSFIYLFIQQIFIEIPLVLGLALGPGNAVEKKRSTYSPEYFMIVEEGR